MAPAQAESSQYFENPRSGTRAFQVVVSRLILRTVTVGALVAAALVASVHLYYRTGSLRNWLFIAAAAALALISWREARRPLPRTLLPLIAMLVVIVARLITADLFIATSLLIPLFAVGTMGSFSLPDSQLRVFSAAFAGLTAIGVISFIVRFGSASGIWRGMVAISVGAALGLALVILLRHETTRFVARFEVLYDGVSIGLIRLSADGRVIAANRRLAQMLGYETLDDVAGGGFLMLLVDRTEEEEVDRLLNTGEAGEVRLRRRDGGHIWARVTFSVVRDAEGGILGYEGLVEDVTENRLARESAAQAEARFGTVFESAPIGMALVTTSGEILRANRAFGALAGSAEPIPEGTQWSSLLGGQLGSVSRLVELNGSGESAEIDIATASGGRKSLRLHVQRPPGPRPGTDFAIVQLLDMTSHIELEKLLREQVRAKNDFIATVSHELRTPLTAVVGFLSELPGSLGDVAEEPAEMLEILASEATSLSNIVEDLLVAARADLEQLSVKSETVPIGESIAHVVRASSRVALDHGATVDTSAVVEATAQADRGRVEQILWNLIVNAVRHGGSTVSIGVEERGSGVVVWVRDDGPGIPSEIRESLFEPFRSYASEEGLTTSMGLGLHVVHTLAELMGGSIEANSRNGCTEFVLTLPIAKAAVAQVGQG
ncbi:MAG: PAS domain S-box protein [Acidimicrobiia bacterium]|nr:PAS domain S-box protein [Acidimicrobiia bacterium]